jgi:hypothetical protein
LSHAVFEAGGIQNSFTADGEDKEEEGGGAINSVTDLDRGTIDRLLKYGAYAIMENEKESELASNQFKDADIDSILKGSRTYVYGGELDSESNKAGLLNFNKASFETGNSDSKIDFNDEQFWEKVLGPRKCDQLLRFVIHFVYCFLCCRPPRARCTS